MLFQHTTAIKRIRRMTARKKVIQGGTSAGKTYAILAVLIHIAAKAKTEISVVSESIPHLRRGAMKDFGKVMQWTNRWRDEGWNKTLLTYTFANGSTIEFFSADQEAKLRGARRQVLYINEANNIDFEAYHQLAIRTSEAIYIDFNPVSEFWAHTEVLAEQDSELIVLTYRDNEALPATIRDDIEAAQVKAATSTYWANWWKVYGLGEVGSLQGVVFDDWQQVDGIDFAGDKLVAIGLDWGYTNDPTAVVAVYKRGSAILLHELIYQNGLTNQDIADHLRKLGIGRSWPIIADSAEPKSIEEVHRLGFNIHPATKGADSIRNSIDILKRQPIFVTRESTNLIKELRNYTWDTDKTGASLGVPIDRYNHAIDAVRYVALNKLSANAGGRYVIM
nr:MAG: terminase large subunit [Caudoviricetes sp.]